MATKSVYILTGGSNNHPTATYELTKIFTNFITQGVVGNIGLNTGSGGTGAFAVSAQGTPDMTVRVTAGEAVVAGTPTGGVSQNFPVYMDAFEDATIDANATGGTRYDWIYLKLDADKLADPAVDASDVLSIVVSRSTSAATDNGTPPTYGYNIAIVTVANGASSITNANITDTRVGAGVTAGRSAFLGAVKFANMTTAQRDALLNPAAGMVIMNTTTNVLNFYNGSAWGAI